MSDAKQHTEAYSSALDKLHAQFPDDVEVSAFYALSLVALAEEDIDAMDNLKKAIRILEPLLEKYPDHPGVAHYLIHAADRPELAAQGLAAARLAEMHKAGSYYQTHAMDFLNYSDLQSGQEAKAREVISHMDHVVVASEEVKSDHRAYLAEGRPEQTLISSEVALTISPRAPPAN